MHRHSPSLRLAAFAALLALGLAPGASAQTVPTAEGGAAPALAPWSWETTPAHLRIAAALREVRRAGPDDCPGLRQRIVDCGHDGVVAQLDILLRARVPETNPKDGPQILSAAQRAVLLSALAAMPSGDVRRELDTRLSKTPDERSAHLGALYALGVVGGGQDLPRMIELLPRRSPDLAQSLPPAAREALREALVLLLRRDPHAWSALPGLLAGIDARAGSVVLDALCDGRDPRALPILLETVRKNRALAWKAAGLVQVCGSSLRTQTDREFLEWIRAELPGATPDYARVLLNAVGALDDGEWVQVLTERLEDEDAGVREEALGALRRISGLGFPGDPSQWRSWYEGEERWHAQRRPKLMEQLALPDSTKVLAALKEYSDHRLHRAAMADELSRALEHGRPQVRLMGIGILERYGSPAACSALLGMLGDSDEKVVQAAWAALRSISGVEIPRDPEALREFLGRT